MRGHPCPRRSPARPPSPIGGGRAGYKKTKVVARFAGSRKVWVKKVARCAGDFAQSVPHSPPAPFPPKGKGERRVAAPRTWPPATRLRRFISLYVQVCTRAQNPEKQGKSAHFGLPCAALF